jgi:hypothetical protein
MSKSKYQEVMQLQSISDFECNPSRWYKVHFGNRVKTLHRSFLESWQYHTLDTFIKHGCVYIAEKFEDL